MTPFPDVGAAASVRERHVLASGSYVEAVDAEHRQVEAAVSGCHQIGDDFADNAGESDGDAYVAALKECIETLAGKAKEAVGLRYRERLGEDEIATCFDMKPNGVKTLLQRARRHLRECIERRVR